MRGCGDGSGVSQFTADIFLSHSTELFRRGTIQGVTDFRYRKDLGLRGLCHNFSSNFFVSQYRRTLQGTLLCCVPDIFPWRIKLWMRSGEYQKFPSILFVSKCRKFLSGNFLTFHYIRVSKKFRDKRGGVNHDFLPKVLTLTVAKNFVGEPFCVSQIFWYRKMLWMRWRGGGWSITISYRKFLVS